MKFVCEQCSTHYSIADEKVRQKILRIRCKNCGNVITVREGGQAQVGVPLGPAITAASGAIGTPMPRPVPPAAAAPIAASLPSPGSVARAAVPAPTRSAAVPVAAPPAPSAPRPTLPPPLARPPARPPEPVRPPEIDEWHLAINGEQSGPQKLTELCRKVIAAAAGAEVFLWKDGMDGWKEPSSVPPVAARIRELKVPVAPPAPPPRAPAPAPPAPPPVRAPRPPGVSRATAGSGLLAVDTATVTPTPVVQPLFPVLSPDPVAARPVARSEFDDGVPTAVGGKPPSPFDDFGNDGATQISPMDLDSLGAAIGKAQPSDVTDEVAGGPDLLVPETMPARAHAQAPAPANGHNGHNGHNDGFPQELFAGNHSMPFFPSPSLAAKAGPTGGPLTGGPPPAESGLSKLLMVGGIFVRKPYLKLVAGAVGVFIIGGAVALAYVGATAPPGPTPSAVAKVEAEGITDPIAAAEKAASAWFPEEPKAPPTRHAVGPAPARPAARPGPRPAPKPAAAPAEVAPPPVAAAPEPTVAEPPPSRKLAAPVERRAVATAATKASSGPSADQLQGIRNTVSSRLSQDSVKACYDRSLRASGGATGGRITVQVSIGMSGKVIGVTLESPDALKPIHGCIKSAVSRWRFPGGAEPYDTQFTLLMQSGG